MAFKASAQKGHAIVLSHFIAHTKSHGHAYYKGAENYNRSIERQQIVRTNNINITYRNTLPG